MNKEKLIEMGITVIFYSLLIGIYLYFSYRSDKQLERSLDRSLYGGIDPRA